jgi:hypothetical protein
MGSTKLRVKVGVHEFEADGPPEEVRAQFEVWKQLISGGAGSAGTHGGITGNAATPQRQQRERGDDKHLDLFRVDLERGLVTLQVHPTGDQRDADAALLILYGYKECMDGFDSVPVTRLKESLSVSGLQPDRIDRTVAPHLSNGLVLKGGRAKGSTYRLTNTGHRRAEELARTLTN